MVLRTPNCLVIWRQARHYVPEYSYCVFRGVNTPTLSAHPLHQQAYRHTPDSLATRTLRELDPDFIGMVSNMIVNNNQALQGQQYAYDNYGYNNADMQYIDEPGCTSAAVLGIVFVECMRGMHQVYLEDWMLVIRCCP